MSVTIARAIVAGCRAAGVTVHESDGAYSRGNGQTSAYMGFSLHHTASGFGRDYPTLYNGRSDLPGPLANTSGNDDGSITLIAAHPANHAGASGGWDTAPLPKTSLFNKLMWGHEVVYPGTVPMRDAQYHSSCVLARVVCDVLGRSLDYAKTHNGTSITGKWDAGYAMGKTYDIAKFRRDAAAVQLHPAPLEPEEVEMLVLGVREDPKRLLLVGGITPIGISAADQKDLNGAGVKNSYISLAVFEAIQGDAESAREVAAHDVAAVRADAEV